MDVGLLGGAFFNNFTYHVDPTANVITLTRHHAATTPSLGEDFWQARFREVRGSLEQLDAYLRDREGVDEARREELERKRTELQARLDELELEANRDGVPRAWRQ
jgi:hypothetical protein